MKYFKNAKTKDDFNNIMHDVMLKTADFRLPNKDREDMILEDYKEVCQYVPKDEKKFISAIKCVDNACSKIATHLYVATILKCGILLSKYDYLYDYTDTEILYLSAASEGIQNDDLDITLSYYKDKNLLDTLIDKTNENFTIAQEVISYLDFKFIDEVEKGDSSIDEFVEDKTKFLKENDTEQILDTARSYFREFFKNTPLVY